jgi:hypothetical protein
VVAWHVHEDLLLHCIVLVLGCNCCEQCCHGCVGIRGTEMYSIYCVIHCKEMAFDVFAFCYVVF